MMGHGATVAERGSSESNIASHSCFLAGHTAIDRLEIVDRDKHAAMCTSYGVRMYV